MEDSLLCNAFILEHVNRSVNRTLIHFNKIAFNFPVCFEENVYPC